MNAFDKINPETAELMEGDVALLEQGPKAPEAPVAPKDPMLTEGVEIVTAKLVSGSCNYYISVSNKDGSHVSRQNARNEDVNMLATLAGHQGYFYARYSGHGTGFSSDASFELLKPTAEQSW